MAHKFKVVVRPHKNKDGSDSKTRKDRFVVHTGRGGRRVRGPFSNDIQVQDHIEAERERLIAAHLHQHPRDMNFRRKHGL